jgi:ABC-type lipoprotein release transport system permease subunit
MGKLLALILGVVMGASLLGSVLGLTVSALTVSAFAVTMLVRRDWVPVIYNVRSLAVRKVTTLVTAVGLALVVFVFTTVLMLGAGIRTTLASTGSDANAKVVRKGSQAEIQSGVMPEHLRLLSAAPEVGPGKDGRPLATAELVVLIFAERLDAQSSVDGTNVTVRGVGPGAFELHQDVQVLPGGRLFTPGTSEIVIGKALVGRFKGMRPGESVHFARRDWKVVGVLDAKGSSYESEIWGDVDQFMDAFQRRPAFSSVTLKLRDPAALVPLEARINADPMLNSLEIKSERRYWSDQSTGEATFITFLGSFVAVIFALGAILGAMITMYAQVAARTREIGTLRALGFRRRSVLVSFVVESILLSLAAGGLGIAGASLMQLASFSTMNFTSFSEVTFRFHLTPQIMVASMAFAALMGYAGGLLPALRAARIPIVQATRGG